MIEEKINELKKQLDKLVNSGAPYDEIYAISREIDKYITLYYTEKNI